MTYKVSKTTYGASVIVKGIISEPDFKQILKEIHQITKGSHGLKVYLDFADVTQLPRDIDVSNFLERLCNEKEAVNVKGVVITLPKIGSQKVKLIRLSRSKLSPKLSPKTFCDAKQAIGSLIGKGRESKA